MLKLENLIDIQSTNQKMIVVTGPYNSGKSTFVKSLSNQATIKIDKDNFYDFEFNRPDLGDLEFGDGKHLFVLERPGATRFTPLWEALEKVILGVVIIFDGSDPTCFYTTRSIINIYTVFPSLPYILVTNPHDPGNAWDIKDLELALKLSELPFLLPEYHTLMTCDATQPHQVAQTVLKLIQTLPDSDYVRTLQVRLQRMSTE